MSMGIMAAALTPIPDSQPDTQPVTQTLDESPSYPIDEMCPRPRYWARLYPATRGVYKQDLTKEKTVVGKTTSSCDVTITPDQVGKTIWNCMSKKHFVISRTVSSDDPLLSLRIELTDLSLNGTFVNNVKVNRGDTVQLHNNDVIAVAKANFKLFVYMESNVPNDEHFIIQKNYAISRRLGMGSYGEVKLIFSKETGFGYAMKVMKKTHFINNDLKMEIEIKILQKINHPNLMRLVEEYDTPSFRYLILQYMEGGDLCERITKNKYLQESQTKLYFAQLVSGMTYLHDKGIIHRDLKPENVLLASNDVNTVVKITDFGLSKILESGCFMQTLCGTKLYVAPEVLQSGNKIAYTEKVDVWSLGVMLYVCLSGKTPFTPGSDNGKSLEDQIKAGKFTFRDCRWPFVSGEAKSLIKKMMMRIPTKRISMADIKRSPWLMDPYVDSKVEELVKSFDTLEPFDGQVNKENKREMNRSSEDFPSLRPSKKSKVERMDY